MVPAVKVVIELAEKLPSIGANSHHRRMTLQKRFYKTKQHTSNTSNTSNKQGVRPYKQGTTIHTMHETRFAVHENNKFRRVDVGREKRREREEQRRRRRNRC